MKKLLALVLALVMTLSLAVVGSNAAFTDADKVNETYSEAVNVLSGMKVFQGYTDGSFQPTGDITRAEVAAIVYRLYTGDVTDTQASLYATYNKFSDMDGAKWAAGYIGYCANAGLIKGYDAKTFGPSNNVTGYEALAMILRAVGYDANGEFTGADWQLHVAQYAQQLGVLQNVKGVDLNAAASRELVAELLFRTAAEVPMVTYSAALGYTNLTTLINGTKNDTLGYKNFKLVATEGTTDDFGRPSRTWNYNTGDKKTVVAQVADATYTTKVDECDIAKDLGLTKETKLEGAYIDGVSYAKNLTSNEVTSNQYATINPKSTTSYVGAQGRTTEVYDMGTAGLRIVEINTYLAKVNSIVAAKTDKNGHVTDAYSNLTVWVNGTAGSVKSYTTTVNGSTATVDTATLKADTDAYAKDSYVLVTISKADKDLGYVTSVAEAKVAGSGTMTKYTATTVTVGGTEYSKADKFELNNPGSFNTAYDVYVDAQGNVIGLAPTAKNYLVVEAIAWQYSGIYNGHAEADVVLADGTRVQGVTIATVDGKTASATGTTGNSAYTAGVVADAKVSAFYTNNSDYYDHLFAYSVDADGNYNIVKGTHTGANANPVDLTGTVDNSSSTAVKKYDISIVTGLTTIGGSSNINRIVANDNTVFLVKDLKTGTYTTYVGKNNVPTMNAQALCALTSGGYATLVLVTDYESANDRFVAYLPSLSFNGGITTALVNGTVTTVYSFDAYKLGTDENTPVQFTSSSLENATFADNSPKTSGLYRVTVKDGVVTELLRLVDDTATTSNIKATAYAPYEYGRVFSAEAYNGANVLRVTTDSSSALKDLYLDDVKAVLAIDQTTKTVSVTDLASIVAGEKLLIAYTEVSGYVHPAYVYVIRNSGSDINNLQAVNSFNVYANAPVAGYKLGGFTSTSSDKVTYDAEWYDYTDGRTVTENDFAQAGHGYTVVVTNVAAKDGYYLAANYSIDGFTHNADGSWTYTFSI